MKIGVGATKALSLLVVWCMVCSAFAGMLVLLVPGAGQALEPSIVGGDRYYGSEYAESNWTIDGGVFSLDGNLTIRSGGTVTIINGGLNVVSSQGIWNGYPFSEVHHITVEDGGQLILRNSVLQAEDILYNATFALGVLIRNGGSLIAEDSQLTFNGKILVDQASFVAYDSVIAGPLFTAMSSNVELYDSEMTEVPATPMSDEVAYPYPFATSASTSLDVRYVFQRNPDSARTTVPEGVADDLTMDDVSNVTLATDDSITIEGFDTGGLFFNEGEALSVTLNALYMTADDFDLDGPYDTFYYYEYLDPTPDQAVDMEVVPTYEAYDPAATNHYAVLTQDLTALDLSAMDLSVLTVIFENNVAQDVYIDRVWVEVELILPAYHNITVAGNSELTAVNSHLGVNHQNYSAPDYRKLIVRDGAQANLYGVNVDGEFIPEGMGPYVTVERQLTIMPYIRDTTTDTTAEIDVLGLLYDEGTYVALSDHYEVDGGQVLNILLNTGNSQGSITDVELLVKWRTDLTFPNTNYIQYYLDNQTPANTGIGISVAGSDEAIESFVLPNDAIVSMSDLSNLHINYVNPNDAGRSALIGYLELSAKLVPQINIYRWAEVQVLDKNGLPVSGADVIALEDGQPASYYYDFAQNTTPPQGVLDYLGVNMTTYGVTDALGMVILPLLTDKIYPETYSGSEVIAGYSVIATYEDQAAINTTFSDVGFDPYPDIEAQVVEVILVMEDLELALPDLVVSSVVTDPVDVYTGDPVTIYVTVGNIGLNAAGRFTVNVTDRIGNITNYLGDFIVENIVASGSAVIPVQWLSNQTTPGTHIITVSVDSGSQIMEVNDEVNGINNNVLSSSVIVLPLLPDLMVDETSVTFSPPTGLAKQQLTITVSVDNIGRLEATDASVMYYIGNPSAGGILIGESLVSVPPETTATTSLDWIPIQIGSYPIYVVVNGAHSIVEYDYTNNVAFGTLRVDIEADEMAGDWLINETEEWSVLGGFTYTANIIVEDQGSLSFTGSQLFIRQDSDTKPTQIVVRDEGTLVLDQTTVTSNYVLRIYLFNDSKLFMYGSTLSSNVILIIDGSSEVYMEGSRVQGDLQAPATSSVSLVAYNSTFEGMSYFGGSSKANLTGASINEVPPVSPSDSAVVTLYSWIEVSVYDGTGEHKIPGAYVEARGLFKPVMYSGVTDETGVCLLQVISDIITADGRGVNYGYYQVNATYTHGDSYQSEPVPTTQVLYNPDAALVRSDALVRLDILGAKPDIDPPFTVSDPTPLRGSEVELTTVINNIGVVTAYDILIRFQDNSSAGMVLIKDYVIDELAPESSITVTVNWTATYPLGNHTLSVTVDPLNEIPELNEDNNYNSTVVNVLGVPDLVVTTGDISTDPTSMVRGKTGSISVNVRNIGDNAISAFNVSFYDDDALIGKREISNLPSGQIGVASISWTPSTPGTHILSVKVDEENVIVESNEADNQAARAVVVRDYPDLLASAVRFSVNGLAVSSVYVNTEVTITVDIYNIGESTADPFTVVFWLNEEEVIGIVEANAMAAGTIASVSTTWIAEIMPDLGLYQDNNISVELNPASNATITHINEMDDPTNANNWANQVLEVVDNRPDMAASNGRVIASSATIGQKVFVLFDLDNVGIIDGTDIIVKVSLVNETIDMPIFTQTVNVGAGESLSYNVSYVVNVTSGNYTFVVDVDAGADSDQSDNVLEIDFTVVVPSPRISINLGNNYDYAPGTSIFVQGTITQSGSNAPLAGQPVKVKIVDSQGFPLTSEYTATTNANGQFTSWVLVPSGQEGTQRLVVTVDTIEGEYSEDVNINIIAPFAPETIPSWVYLLIVAIVIAVIVIFSLYLYRVGLGRMVECGNCGALIPEASRHCPKCGVEFETDTAKCSECGAWIPSKAESCPDCGAKFMTEPVEAGQAPGYIEAMRKQYEEYIEAFRGQAKAALGSKYSEEKFMEWLQTEPNYLPFEEWLRKEEMSRRSGVFPCPACGTLNPRDSKICNRCGTVFEQQGKSEAPKAEEKKSPFRRIVRRSSEPKEAPKEPEAPKEEPKETEDKPQ